MDRHHGRANPVDVPSVLRRPTRGIRFRSTVLLSGVALAAGLTLPALVPPASVSRRLTFEERLAAQEAIERVYHRHQQGSRRTFEEALPREALVARVEDSLRKSAALERLWNTPLTAKMLEREVERMVRDTRMPDRLAELFTALDHDTLLIQECLARPILVDRLTRRFFEADERWHAAAREEMETLRADLASGAIDPTVPHARRSVVDVWRRDATPPGESGDPAPVADGARHLELDPEAFERERALTPREIGAVGPVQETPGAFVVRVLLEAAPDRLRLASFAVPKRTWDEWWGETRGGFDAAGAVVVADERWPLPAPAAPAVCLGGIEWVAGVLEGYAPLEGRVEHTAVWTGSEMIVWGGGTSTSVFDSGARYDPATDTWRRTSPAGTPRRGHTAVWTGSTMLVWGGWSGTAYVNTGGRYDPTTDTWTPTSTILAPFPRYGHVAVWTGTKMVVWGGYNGTAYIDTGGIYDPLANTWTNTAEGPTSRTQPATVWTGSEMLVWGGWDGNHRLRDGGRFNPTTNSWTPMTGDDPNQPLGRFGHTAVWTGSEMIVWGAAGNTGGRYRPSTNSWLPTSTGANVPSGRDHHSAVWTGSRMVVWGGRDEVNPGLATGAAYDPATDTWSPVSTVNAPTARHAHTAVWTGEQMLVWGGEQAAGSPYTERGGRYDPATDSWSPTWFTSGAPESAGATGVWTGNELLIWGGATDVPNGGRYDPTSDTWRPASATGAPSLRQGHAAVWTGDEMIVWGGEGAAEGTVLDTGGRYDPLSDTWAATASIDAPGARRDHTAVWTGSRMIVWGGSDGAALGSGGRYDPLSDSWTATASIGAPLPRLEHTAIWTGSRMIVWGGRRGPSGTNLGDGALYDPVLDAWEPTAAGANVPSPRRSHEAVWTGSEMIVWGGYGNSALNTGGRFDPAEGSMNQRGPRPLAPDGAGSSADSRSQVDADTVADGGDGLNWADTFTSVSGTWLPTTTTGAPSSRFGHTAIWTGSTMITWGGRNTQLVPTATGAQYDPSADAWFATPMAGAPPARAGHVAVWTGNSMIVWGGVGSQGLALSGGICSFGGEDLDGDGICSLSDCDDGNPHCATDCTDQDGDGWCLPADCYDLSASCVASCSDADGDGVPACAPDCDEANPHCTTDCTDADGDGWCVGLDCDDTASACTSVCTDADGDGVGTCAGDCDDAKPHCTTDCTDADGDEWCVTSDCDDTKPNCTTDCTDADGDGWCVTSDCNDLAAGCTTICVDGDGDGVPVCAGDCDDTDARCSTDCTDADGDGWCVDSDCDDTKPNCTTDCTDQDGDSWCVTSDCNDLAAGCTTTCVDDDGDGVPVCAGDCDDTNPHCSTDCTDADGDGWCVPWDCDDDRPLCGAICVDGDGDGACVGIDCDDARPFCIELCHDADGDGYCPPFDCQVNNPRCQADCTDADGDGWCVTDDCDDGASSCRADCTDADGDGLAACRGDCNDANPHCTESCVDPDGDGFCAPFDCLETNPFCQSDCTDEDGDGYCVTSDCDDARPNCAESCVDADGDDHCVDFDCDDANPGCMTDCTDGDGDGSCVDTDCNDTYATCQADCTDADADGVPACAPDCDESNPHCTTDCTDADGDGWCVTSDCDDTEATCSTGCSDLDGDGFTICGGDCDDASAAAYPGGTEVCTDNLDNDCNGFVDEADATCVDLSTGELRFDSPTALHWEPAPGADAHALYRGSIAEIGMRGYTHLCEATMLASANAVDPDVPPPGQGYYYLAAGLAIDPGGAIAAGSLGASSSGVSRPDRAGLSCGARVYVDADVVGGARNGLSWADAYTGVGDALGHALGAGRGIEVWARQSLDGTARVSGSLHPGLRLLGGFDGTEATAWERSPELHPAVWDGSGTAAPLLTGESVDLVIDGVTLRAAAGGVRATVDDDHVEIEGVRLEQMSGWGVDLEVVGGGRVVVERVVSGLAIGRHRPRAARSDRGTSGSDARARVDPDTLTGGHNGLIWAESYTPQGSFRARVRDGVLDGRVRNSVLDGGDDGAIVLEAQPTALGASAEVRVDVVGNTVTGGARGIVLGSRVVNRAATAVQASFVDSNVVTGTLGEAIAVEATGTFTTVSLPATVRSAPIVSNNTLDGGQGAGIACRALRADSTANPAIHPVSAVPELWTNLITHHAGSAIEESIDDEATGLVSDPRVVSNGFFADGALYLDEGSTTLTDIAAVNALAGAAGNFDGDPLYEDRDAGDYRLRYGSVVGTGSPMRYLANGVDPGLGLGWTLPSFDDSAWDVGVFGVGYDTGPDSPPPSSAAALIDSEVPAGTLSVFTRSVFEVADAAAVTSLTLGADYDDGYVAWINGVEVFRSASMPPGAVAWDTAAAPHESSNGSEPSLEQVDISAAGIPLLVAGTNVLAIGVWNASAASTDLVLAPRLIVNEESVAIDAGLAGAPRVGKEDRDGRARTRDGDLDGVGSPDAGAYER